MVGAAEPDLNASTAAGTQQKLLGNRISIGVVVVQVLLNTGNQSVDPLIVIHFDQELNEGRVLPFGRIHEQEAQSAAADK